MRSSATKVVCDAGPIIHLDELDCLDLLADFDSVLVPESVHQEAARHRPRILRQERVLLSCVQVALPSDVEFVTLVRAFALNRGEQEALALMYHQPVAILLTDDAAARLVAEQLEMRVHGTIGILLRAIRRGLRTPAQVLDLLRQLPQRSTLYIRPQLINEIITRVRSDLGID